MSPSQLPMDRRRFLGLAGAAVLGTASLQVAAGCGSDPAPRRHRTGLVHDPRFRLHRTREGHPESPERYDAVVDALRQRGFMDRLHPIDPRAATVDELRTTHEVRYLELARREIESGEEQLSTGDTSVGPGSWEVAVLAAGGALSAVDWVVGNGEGPSAGPANAFCVVRPPGHHATPDRGMGFCILSNVAVAAHYAQSRHGLERIAIVDWDVHHGNGTQDVFYADDSVHFFSTHQSPWYPWTGEADEIGEGDGEGFTLNRPFPSGSGRDEILGAFEDEWVPAMDAFRPELVLVSAGFDSREGDPLGEFRLTDQDFRDLTRVVLSVADRHASGRLVSVLEGGYSLEGLAAAATAHVEILAASG